MECFRFFFGEHPRRIIPFQPDAPRIYGGFAVSRKKRPAHRGMRVMECREVDEMAQSQAMGSIDNAFDEAQRLSYDFVAPAMLLWGAVADASSVSAKIMRRIGVELEDLRRIAGDEMRQEEAPADGSWGTPEARSITRTMREEGEGLNFKLTGNVAVLMAACTDRSGKVQKVLEMLNVDPDSMRAKIIKELKDMQKVQKRQKRQLRKDASDDVQDMCKSVEESMTPHRSLASASTCTSPESLNTTEVQAMARSVSRQESCHVEQKVNRPRATYYMGTTVLVHFEGKTTRCFHPPAINANAIKVFHR